MTDTKSYEIALTKGNRFFSRKNYQLAKKEFERVLAIKDDMHGCTNAAMDWMPRSGDAELREKLKICVQEEEIRLRSEAIKRARKLEKKHKIAEALELFSAANEQQTEDWLQKKIDALQTKVQSSHISAIITKTEQTNDATAQLNAYDEALKIGPNPQLLEKKAFCLLSLGKYKEALDVFNSELPASDRGHYYLGFAYAKTGDFVSTFEQWQNIASKDQELIEQYKLLIPFAYRQLLQHGGSFKTLYYILNDLCQNASTQELRALKRRCMFSYIKELWQLAKYQEIHAILAPLPEKISLELLGLYAKLFFKLAIVDNSYLEQAITFWLTAIYNDRLLANLDIYKNTTDISIQAIREKLLVRLEQLVARIEVENGLSQKTQAHWKVEKRIIESLATIRFNEDEQEILICTPAFAHQFGMSEQVLAKLKEQHDVRQEKGEFIFEISAYFSKGGINLLLIEGGEEDKAIELLRSAAKDEFSSYCQQRAAFQCGLKKALKKDKRTKMFFTQALPLMQKYPSYIDELVKFTLSELDEEVYVVLADALEPLIQKLKNSKLSEATAYALGNKAMVLLGNGSPNSHIRKICDKALSIDQECHAAIEVLGQLSQKHNFDRYIKAIEKGNCMRAASIVVETQHHTMTQDFFSTMQRFFQDVREWDDDDEKTNSIFEFYQSCRYVDNDHPVSVELRSYLKERGKL